MSNSPVTTDENVGRTPKRPFAFPKATLFLLAVALLGSLSSARADEPMPFPNTVRSRAIPLPVAESLPPECDDASLHAVCFVGLNGWAVGDRGMIWKTMDGGQNWRSQLPTGLIDRHETTQPMEKLGLTLHSVWFLDEQQGWVAGERFVPFTGTRTGVLWQTLDGGATWHEQSTVPVASGSPTENLAIRFTNWSDAPVTKLLSNRPANQPLENLDARVPLPALHFVRFWDSARGLAMGVQTPEYPAGLLQTDDGGKTWRALPQPADLSLDSRNGFGTVSTAEGTLMPEIWRVGDDGRIVRCLTESAGAGRLTCRFSAAALPRDVVGNGPWSSLSVVGPELWAVGRMTSSVWHSADAGRKWKPQAIDAETSAPLNGICFRDAEHGCAVGAFGRICVTEDGGQTWTTVRGQGRRAGLLIVSLEGPPLALAAREAAEQGQRLVALKLVSSPHEETAHRWRASVLSAGGQEGAMIESPAEELSPAGPRSEKRQSLLCRTLAVQIRLWRPDVVVWQGPDVAVLKEAVTLAAQSAVGRDGLQAWSVASIYAQNHDGARAIDLDSACVRIHPQEELPRSGQTLAAAVSRSRVIWRDADETVTTEQHYYPITAADSSPPARDRKKERRFQGLSLSTATCRIDPTRPDVPRPFSEWRNSSKERTATQLWELAEEYNQRGQGKSAERTLFELLEKHPQHPAAVAAAKRLMTTAASTERAWIVGDRSHQTTSAVVQAGGAPDSLRSPQRLLRSWTAAEFLYQHSLPDFFAPDTQRACASLLRQRGDESAIAVQQRLGRLPPQDPIAVAAQAELWLVRPQGKPPRWVMRCHEAANPPHLDGDLSDECWQHAEEIALDSAASGVSQQDLPSVAWVSWDRRFLYLAAKITLPEGSPDVEPRLVGREHDAELTEFDRVRWSWDADRDGVDAFILEADQRGWTADSCGGDTSWNPTWYVAAARDGQCYTLEAAVPWSSLAPLPPPTGGAWNLRITRTLPTTFSQTWPARESTGYCRFESAP